MDQNREIFGAPKLLKISVKRSYIPVNNLKTMREKTLSDTGIFCQEKEKDREKERERQKDQFLLI